MTWKDEDIESALRGLREEDVPLAALANVRARVLERASKGRAPCWSWTWAPAAAAAVLVMVMLWPRQEATLPTAAPALPAAPEEALVRPPLGTQPVHVQARKNATAPAPRIQTEFIRLFTEDPDVVIYWSLASTGGAE
jgi:anti-sigma factor RsiW